MVQPLLIFLFSTVSLVLSWTIEPPYNLHQARKILDLSDQVTIAIIATNDIHGAAFPSRIVHPKTKQQYNYGGLVYMASMIQTIRKQNGKNNTLWLDAGDQFQGGIQSSKLVSNGKIMNSFFNMVGLDSAAIGNHQFDYGPNFLDQYLLNNRQNSLSANIFSKNGKQSTNLFPNTRRSKIIRLGNGIKIGVIGLTTMDAPQTSFGFTNHLFSEYNFLNYSQIVIQESKHLRILGAQIIVVVAHEGNKCPGQSMDLRIWKNHTRQQECPQGPITKMIQKLPSGTIDAVVQGHKHQIVHFYKNNIPIVGVVNGGYYFNIIYLTYNKITNKVTDTSIQGPIPVCQKVFSKINRCHYVEPENINSVGTLTQWKFHNTTVVAHSELKQTFRSWKNKMEPYYQRIVSNTLYLKSDKNRQCQLCNLQADLLLETVDKADFSIVNPGGLRSVWLPGQIQYQHIYNMFPFDNHVQSFNITGKQLKKMFQVLQAGKFGYYTSSGLVMTVTSFPKSLVNISFADGSQIIEDKNYLGVTLDFLLSGGDDMGSVLENVYSPRNVTDIGDFKTLIKPLLGKKNIITKDNTKNMKAPKLIVV